MDSTRWQKVEELVQAALEIPAGERDAWLVAQCPSEASLREEVTSLLAFAEGSDNFLRQPAAARAARILLKDEAELSRRGELIGPYKVVREIGRGGMGTVYLAQRADDQYEKLVAIKVLRRGMDTEDILGRFRTERQILASLEHPHIAHLIDGGLTADDLPYFVLEYIEGERLDHYCDQHQLATPKRLQLFRKVCAAVQYAHQNLIVHRDLKPSNILVTAAGEPKLLDFGIAKLLNPQMTYTIAPTATQSRLMTPEYASPEQVRGQHVTTATDIYSLGVILYELLTGARPYKLKDTSPEELSRLICESEPSKPSKAIRDVETEKRSNSAPNTGGAEPEPTLLNSKFLRGDIDNIVLMALRKDPTRRYRSVEQFSEDIGRHLKGLPVIARKDTFGYRAEKFIQRNKIGVVAASLVILAVLFGLIATTWQARVARQQRDRAAAAQAKAEEISAFLATALSYADPTAASSDSKNRRDATIKQMLDEVAPRLETELAGQPEARASLERIIGSAYFSQVRTAEAERYLNEALTTQLKLYGEDHLETARTRTVLAAVQYNRGDLTTAIKTAQRALTIYRSQQQKGPTDIRAWVRTLVIYGDMLWTQGDYNQAEAADTEALALASQLPLKDGELVAGAKSGLGLVRYAQGRLDEAAKLLREAVADYRKLPYLRWRLSNTLNPLGQVLTHQREFAEALTVLHESETISREIFGENNEDFARTLYLQAYALCFKGDYAEAERILNKVEEIYDRYYAANKVSKANVYDTRAMILTRTGRATQGETFARQATALYQNDLTRGSNGITLARLHWAESLVAQKKYAEAEKLLLETYKDASEIQGVQHWRTKQVAQELAGLYEKLGKPDLANDYLTKAQ